MKYALYRELLGILEEFEIENPAQDKQNLDAFSLWLHQKNNKIVPKIQSPKNDLDINIGKFATFMVRYARNYSKKALENTLLTTTDDFVFLASIFHNGGISQTALITSHLLEKTSGVEVIKRLLKNDLIMHKSHQTDKRSKILVITEQGKDTFLSSLNNMQKVAKIVGGKLSQEEKQQLIYLLEKLNDFHNSIYLEDKNMDLDKILTVLNCP